MKIPKTPEVEKVLKDQRKAFKKRFGRFPKPGEPLFFDPDVESSAAMGPDQLTAEMLSALKSSAAPAEVIYAFRKTGRLLLDSKMDTYPADAVTEWQAAIKEYFQLEAESRTKADTPRTRARKRPGGKVGETLALTEADWAHVFKCMDALDTVLSVNSLTVRARVEIASGLLALACDSAFESAIAQGGDSREGHTRAALFAKIAFERAHEIYNQMEHEGDAAGSDRTSPDPREPTPKEPPTKHYVRLIRPRFEVAYMVVEAEDHDQAEALAYNHTEESVVDWKLIDHSPEDYHAFVERCYSANDLEANEMTPEDAAKEFGSTEVPKYNKYLTMHADTATGEGQLCEQPWIWEVSLLMKADLCSDWSDALGSLAEGDPFEDLDGDDEEEASESTKELLAGILRGKPKRKE